MSGNVRHHITVEATPPLHTNYPCIQSTLVVLATVYRVDCAGRRYRWRHAQVLGLDGQQLQTITTEDMAEHGRGEWKVAEPGSLADMWTTAICSRGRRADLPITRPEPE